MFRNTVLSGGGFFRLWAGQAVSQAGSQITDFALPLVAVISLHATAMEMGLLTASGSLAALVLGLSAGVWADKYERRKVMLVANAVSAVALLVVPVLYWLEALSVPVLLSVAFVLGATSLLFESAVAAYLPRLVSRDALTSANSWFQSTESAGGVVGPGLAGLVVELLGAPLALLADLCSFVAGSVVLLTLPKAAPEHDAESEQSHRQAIVEGLRMLWRNSALRALVVAAAHFNLFTSMFFALYALYAVRVLHFSPFLLGVVSMAGGVAGLLSSAVAGRLTRWCGTGPLLIACYAVPGIAGLLVPAAASFDRSAAALCMTAATFIWIFCIVILLINGMTLNQQMVPDEYLGRVSATFRFIAWGIEPLGALLGGVLGTAVGLRQTMVIATLGIIPSALWPLFSEIRAMGPSSAEPAEDSDPVAEEAVL